MPIANRWRAAPARDSPATSMSHGTAHRPWIAMNGPVQNAASGAIHRKRGCRRTVRTPSHCARNPAACIDLGVSGTRHAIHAAATSVSSASATKMLRQVDTRNVASSGVVAASAPRPPANMIQPDSEACRCAGYHVAIALSGDMRHAHTPSPITARANASPGSDSACAKSSAPAAAKHRSAGSTRRGP